MARNFSVKLRNTGRKTPKPVLLLVAEGRNVTETLYFRQFQKQHASYMIKIIAPGSVTDPKGMLEKLETYWLRNGMDFTKGDRGFVVLDLDCDDRKAKLIKELETSSKVAQFVISNPCFEVWFLLHYKYTTHVYLNGAEVLRDLRSFIPDYEKNKDITGLLSDKTEFALQNAEKLAEHYDKLGYKWPSNKENPRTDVPIVLAAINSFK